MRRLLIAGLFLLLTAPAAGQSTGDALCRQVSPSKFTCTGADKLVDLAKAQCRHLGLPEAACTLPLGQQVTAGAVDEYGLSWVHQAQAFQYRLAGSLPLRHGAWMGTHNSFNAVDPDRPTASNTDSNQQLSLTQQLDSDIRAIELDVHIINGVPTVCHGLGPDQGNAGCTSEPPLTARLPAIAQWLDAHRGQVILLYLEDEIKGGTGKGYDDTVAALKAGLGSRIYAPRGTGCVPLPDDVTRNQVRRSGAQVVLVGNCAKGWSSLVYAWNDVEVESGSTAKYQPFPACDASYKRDVYAAKMVRYYEDSTFVSAVTSPTTPSSDPEALTPQKAGAMIRCGVNLFGFDQLLPADGRLKATVWSWRPNWPRGRGCATMGFRGRWTLSRCKARPACVARGVWRLGRRVGYARAARECRRLKARFALPRTGYENSLLHEAAGHRLVMLRYRR